MLELTPRVVNFINKHSKLIDDEIWNEFMLCVYNELSDADAEQVMHALRDGLSMSTETIDELSEPVLIDAIIRILKDNDGHSEAAEIVQDLLNYLGREEEDVFDFILNDYRYWRCEFEDNGYIIHLNS
jgi:hypothetical protein